MDLPVRSLSATRRAHHRIALLLTVIAVYAILTSTLFELSDFPFDSDEAVHALDGLRIASDVYHGEGKALLEDIYFTHWYPPLLPTYLASFLLFLGPATWSARYAVLLLSIIYLALMYQVASALSRRSEAGLIALLLAATSSFVWMQSLMAMEEMLALIGVLLTILVYSRSEHGRGNPIWIGLCIAGTLLARLSIGISVAAAVAVAVFFGPGRPRRKIMAAWRIFAPLALVCAAWWGHPQKVWDFLGYVQASPPAYESLRWVEASFYWRAMVTTFTVSPLVGALVLASIVLAVFHWAETNWRLPLALVATTWVVLLIEKQLNVRFFAAAVSASFLLAGNSFSRYLHILPASTDGLRTSVIRAVLVLAVTGSSIAYLIARIDAFPFLMEVALETDTAAAEMYSWITDTLTDDSPVFLINGWDQLSGIAYSFHEASTRWPRWRAARAIDVLLVDPQEHPEAVTSFQESVMELPRSYVVHLGNTPVPSAGAWWAYQAALQPCWGGDWESTRSFWIGLWDGGMKAEVISHPFRYVRPEDRLAARESYRYPLSVEAKIAVCDELRR